MPLPDTPPPAAMSGSDLRVRINDVVVEGGLAGMQGATDVVTSGLVHRVVTVGELYQAAQAIEVAYARAGYILVRVVVPAQDLRDGGDVRLVVVNGFIERVDTSALPPQVRDHVARVLAPLARRPGIGLSEIERRVLLAGETPGAAMKTTLARGGEAGGSVLIVESAFAGHGVSIDVDNGLGKSLGTYNGGVGLTLNSPWGRGEQLYARINGDPAGGWKGIGGRDPINRSVDLGALIPLSADGLSLSFDALGARTAPKHAGSALGMGSDFSRVAIGLRYAMVRARRLNLNTSLSFDADQDRLSAIVPIRAPISLDRTRVVRLGLDGFAVQDGASLRASLTASFGLDGFGARTRAKATPDLPLSRQGADARFSKVEADIAYLSNLGRFAQLSLHVRGQTSFDKPLLTSEQAGLAGPGALSAFDSGLLQGDTSVLARAELASPGAVSFRKAGLAATPYIFVAAGKATTIDPTALEPGHVTASSYGLGVRLGLAHPASGGTLLSVEWARGRRDDVHGTRGHVGVSLSSQF
jgi:hemolysin activation/secretion protein